MISDQKLYELNQRGFIPGPKEDEEAFLLRVKTCENSETFLEDPPFPLNQPVPRHHWDLKRCDLKALFDFAPDWLPAYYNNHKLSFWHGAMTWIMQAGNGIKFPLVQFRPQFKKGSYLGVYHLEEILAHEAAHAARMAFDEPNYEELLCYLTSSNLLRRVFGPIIKRPWEIFLFFGFLLGIFFWQAFDFIGDFSILVKVFYVLSGSWLSLGCIRLFKIHYRFKKAFKKLQCLVGDKVFPVLFRLTDKEIKLFSKSSMDEIQRYALNNKTLRWRLIRLYFPSKLRYH